LGNDYWLVNLGPLLPPASSPFILTALSFTNSVFAGRVSGLSNDLSIVVYAATNLSNWAALLTNPPVAGSFDFVDVFATNWPRRFYRAALIP
jgi:hypothetical protein